MKSLNQKKGHSTLGAKSFVTSKAETVWLLLAMIGRRIQVGWFSFCISKFIEKIQFEEKVVGLLLESLLLRKYFMIKSRQFDWSLNDELCIEMQMIWNFCQQVPNYALIALGIHFMRTSFRSHLIFQIRETEIDLIVEDFVWASYHRRSIAHQTLIDQKSESTVFSNVNKESEE